MNEGLLVQRRGLPRWIAEVVRKKSRHPVAASRVAEQQPAHPARVADFIAAITLPRMKITVIIPAAGVGKRFAGEDAVSHDAFGRQKAATSKIEQEIHGKPVFLRSIDLFTQRQSSARAVIQILLAVNPDAIESFKFKWGERLRLFGIEVIAGGKKERWETVMNALRHVDADATHIAVHDAARPLATPALIDRVFEAGEKFAAVIPGLPVASTLKRVDPTPVTQEESDPLDAILGSAGKTIISAQRVTETVSRSNLVEVQTPQLFEASLLRRAYAQIAAGQVDTTAITDDAGLIEALGEPVYVVDGEVTNLKITRAADMEFATALVNHREAKTAVIAAKKKLFVDEEE